jgi:hypothetical protein
MEMSVLEARTTRSATRSESLADVALYPGISVVSKADPSPQPQTCCGETLRPFWADDGRYISVCMRCGSEHTHQHMVRYNGSPWIGVDLDGTLAHEIGEPQDADQIGEPVEPMMRRVRQWIADGKTVKIFTARASVPRQIDLVKQWLKQHNLPDLEVTNAKDFLMVELWDDRAVRVETNSGQPVNATTSPVGRGVQPMKIVARRKAGGSFVSKLRMFFAL